TWPQFLERIHPEDRPQIEQKARMEASGKEWPDSQIDFRIILPDGTIKHLHSFAHPVRDDSGEITEVVGTVMDVTEQWQARIELEKAFEEIKQRTEAARRSERELRDMVNTVPAHVWRTSPEGQVYFVNDRWLQFTGLALDEAFGWKWEAVLHPDDRTRVVADWHTAVKNGQAMENEARVRRAEREYCWWFIRNVPMRDETGKLVRWYGTAIDIEDRKRAEQALRKSEERWRSVFENSAIGVALTDLNGRFLATNHVYQTIVGYTEQELRALCFLDVTHEDYRQTNWALITELLEGKRRQFQIEKKYLRKDGSSIWVSNNVSLVPGTERVPRFIMALSEDITQRKRAEEALQQSEGYLAEAQKLTHTGSWAWNVRTGVLFRSREIFSIYDYEYQEMGPTWPQFLERVHPEDRPQIEQRARIEASGRDWLDSQIDFRIILPDGTIKHLHSVAHPVRDDSGEVTEVVGTVMDVTEQWKARTELEKAFEEVKQRTEAARRSERGLRDVVNTVPAHVWSTSPEGQVDFVNDRGVEFTGLALAEAFGWKWEAVLHPDVRTRVVADWHTAVKNGQAMESEARVRRADGEYCWWFIRNVPLRDETGKLVRWYGTAIDIEDRKLAEQALRR